LKIGKFECFRIIEFQEGTGMVHYHLLIDREFIDWYMLKDAWGKGGLVIKPVVGATVGYLTKYVTKGTPAPKWVQGYLSNLRMASSTRHFWDEIGGARKRVEGVQALECMYCSQAFDLGEDGQAAMYLHVMWDHGQDSGEASAAVRAAMEVAGVDIPSRRRRLCTIGEVLAHPERHVSCLWRIITSAGQELYRSVKMDILASVDMLRSLGMEPLINADTERQGRMGQLKLSCEDRSVLLGQLLHCGTEEEALSPDGRQWAG
jgi:hypothetical protein